jgi:hypothetical protein
MKTKLMAVAIVGLFTLAGVGSAAPQAPNPLAGTWGHAETYRVCDLTLMADGSYCYSIWSLGGEVVETGTYTYAGDVLTLRPQRSHTNMRGLPLDEGPRVAVLTWIGEDRFELRFQSGPAAGDSLQLSRR